MRRGGELRVDGDLRVQRSFSRRTPRFVARYEAKITESPAYQGLVREISSEGEETWKLALCAPFFPVPPPRLKRGASAAGAGASVVAEAVARGGTKSGAGKEEEGRGHEQLRGQEHLNGRVEAPACTVRRARGTAS